MKSITLSSQTHLILFTLLSAIYYILNIIFPTDFIDDSNNSARFLPQIAGGLMSAYFSLIILNNFNIIWANKILRRFFVFLLLSICYVAYPFRIESNIAYITRSTMAIITMLALYVIIIKSKNNTKWNFSVFAIYLLQYTYCIITLINDRHAYSTIISEGFDSNSGFMLLTCIPLGLMFPIKKIRIYLYITLLVACFYSGQRSAALSALISFPLCIYYLRKDVKKKDILILVCLFLIIGLPLMREAIDNIKLRNEYDSSKGELGSGRLVFWKMVLNGYIEGNTTQYFFGHGTNSVADLLYKKYGIAIGAHNGWLDILYSYGALGFLLYLSILVRMLFPNKKQLLLMSYRKPMYIILFTIFIVRASSSHGYFDISMIPFCSAIAVIEGTYFINKMEYLKNKKQPFSIGHKKSIQKSNHEKTPHLHNLHL